MLEIKNECDIPIDLVLSPVQKRKKTVQISIPANGTFSGNVTDACTKFLSVIKLGEKYPFWEGVIPTCISRPILIDATHNALTYNNRKLIGKVYDESIFSSNYKYMTIILILSVVVGIWLYRKYKK